MKSKVKLTITILAGLLLLLAVVYFLKSNSGTEKTVKIVDYNGSICTQDVPSSSCSFYEVIIQSADGHRSTYKVAGFSNRDSKLYDEITSKITTAKENKTQVTLKVNDKDEIISVQ